MRVMRRVQSKATLLGMPACVRACMGVLVRA